jgi:hypothetical protein
MLTCPVFFSTVFDLMLLRSVVRDRPPVPPHGPGARSCSVISWFNEVSSTVLVKPPRQTVRAGQRQTLLLRQSQQLGRSLPLGRPRVGLLLRHAVSVSPVISRQPFSPSNAQRVRGRKHR